MEANPFIALLLITGLAVVVPLFASRLRWIRLPIVVGEIFAGIIIGRSGFDLVDPSPTLTFLAEFGFAYLMFLSGLEVDFNLLIPSSRERSNQTLWTRPLPIALVILTGTILLALLGSYVMFWAGIVESPALVGLILSTTSLGVVVPVLKEREIIGSRYGQFLLVASSSADFVTLLLLTIVIAIQSQGLTLDLLLIPVLISIFILAVRIVQRFGSVPVLQRVLDELSSATAQIRVRGAFALMVAWVVLAEALGVEVILGAFLAGAIAGLLARSEDTVAREKLDAIGYGFFIPIFFIMVGVDFNLRALLQSPQALLLVPLLILIAYLVKIIPSFVLRRNFSWRKTIAGGFLLSSRLSLIIAAAAIALNIGAISEAVNAAIILLAVLTCTLSPMIFNRLYIPDFEERREGVIIIGKDQLAEFLAVRLNETGEKVTVLCPDESRFESLKRLPLKVVSDAPDIENALVEAGAEGAEALIDLTSTAEETLAVCHLARERFNMPIVVSRIGEVELLPELQHLGVRVVQPTIATAMALEGALRYPTAFDVLGHQTEDVDVIEVDLRNRELFDTPLRRIRLPGNALILSLYRDDSVTVPDGDTVLRRGDRLGLIGSPDSLQLAVTLISG
jgi:Kef-type K+ transport system membrane component KefB/Trk K+ transport system NAD-binding subunit